MQHAGTRPTGGVTLVVVIAAALAGCRASRSAAPGGAGPDYARAFPQDRVGRLDLTISPAAWAQMRSDLEDQLGPAGARPRGGPGGGPGHGPPGGGPPPEALAACAGADVGAACTVQLPGRALDGTCQDLDATRVCVPAGGPGGPGGAPGDGAVRPPIDLVSRTPIYVECTVRADGQTWSHVGIRFKGNSSLASSWGAGQAKLPLRLSFDHFDDRYPSTRRQRFFGFKTLSLSNGWGDPSLVRDKVGTDVFREAGLPAPATAFYRVFLDHGDGAEDLGVYTAIEVPSDKVFLRTHFGSDDGNLYKPNGEGATLAVFDAASMGKDNHEAAADFSDVRALQAALHADRTDRVAWRAGLGRWFEVDGFLRWLAVNSVIQDWDSYGQMAHNYYLYGRPARGGQLSWIPWDHSFAFATGRPPGPAPGPAAAAAVRTDGDGRDRRRGPGRTATLGHDEVDASWPLIRFLLDDPTYRARYDTLLAEVVATVYEPARARARFTAARALIEPLVSADQAAAFAQAHAELQAHPAARAAAVTTYLETRGQQVDRP